MKLRNRRWLALLAIAGMTLLVAACSPPSPQDSDEDTPTLTPTPTATAQAALPDPSPTPTPTPKGGELPVATTPPPLASRCAGLSGQLEIQVLVGPAEVAGLEPVAVGQIPFSAATEGPPYAVQGGGAISYEDVLVKEWGTYAVTLEMDGTVEGECVGAEGDEELDLKLELSGEQMVEVDAEGFQGEYPWTGTHTFDLSFPLEEGATVEGEGWSFVLRLGGG